MASLLDLFGAGVLGGDPNKAAPTESLPGVPDGFAAYMSTLPGLQGMTSQQKSAAFNMALLNGGLSMMKASGPRMDGRPSLTDAFSSGVEGFSGGLSGMSDQALKGAMINSQIGAHNATAMKGTIDALKEQQKMLAQAKFVSGDRSEATLAALMPEKFGETILGQMTELPKQLATKGMVLQNGRAVMLPGYAEEEGRAAGMKSGAEALAKFYPIEPGGSLVSPGGAGGMGAGGGMGGGPAGAPMPSASSNPFAAIVSGTATQLGIDPALALRMAGTESGFDPRAVSPKGNKGLLQVGDAVQQDYGIADPFDPVANAKGGLTYFRDLLTKYGGRQDYALTAYNWGPTNTDKWLQNGAYQKDLPAETQGYLRKVLGGNGGAVDQGGMTSGVGPSLVYQSSQPAPGTQQGKFDAREGEHSADDFRAAQIAVKTHRGQLGRLETMAGLLDGIETGKFTDWKLELKRGAKGIGLDLGAFGINENTGPEEAARGLANQIALELRSPASGAGMPGAMSDKDREFLVSMVPGLVMSADGRKLAIDMQRKIVAKADAEAALYRDYRRNNGGRVDFGIYDKLADLEKQDTFGPDLRERIAKLSTGGQVTKDIPPPPRGAVVVN